MSYDFQNKDVVHCQSVTIIGIFDWNIIRMYQYNTIHCNEGPKHCITSNDRTEGCDGDQNSL